MDARRDDGILSRVIGLVLAAGMVTAVLAVAAAPAQEPVDSLPPEVTPEVIAQGKSLFHGAGLCAACHGPGAQGIQGLGPSLADTVWLHSKGTYGGIVRQILTGVPPGQSTSAAMMPPLGGSRLTDEQVKAVAAYVWSLSHPRP